VIEPIWFDYAPDMPAYESFPDVYSPMILAGRKIQSSVYGERWIDLGSARLLLKATIDNLVGNIIPNTCLIGKNARVTLSVLTGQTKIGDRCSLNGVLSLGPAIVRDDCELSECILCPGAEITAGTKAKGMIFHETTATAISDVKG
jgi:NDP-sugar pyrophosphorylase family protein